MSTSHTYELRPTRGGWLLVVDEKLLRRFETLPEANLALIGARAGHTSTGTSDQP